MTSYLKSWLYAQNPTTPPTIETSASAVEDDDDTETVHGDDDDAPPAFPAVNSAQRATSGDGPIPRILTDTQLMPPPPTPSRAVRRPGVSSSHLLAVSPVSSSSLLVPTTTTKPPANPSKRAKVVLAPGHGPLDWANLKKSGQNLRVRSFSYLLRRSNSQRRALGHRYTFTSDSVHAQEA